MGLSPIAPGTGSHFFGVQAWHGVKLGGLYCFCLNKKSINLWVHYYPCYRGADLRCFCFFFCLDTFFDGAQKKQKIKENPIAPRVFPGLRAAKANL